jgi:hypothetical protein
MGGVDALRESLGKDITRFNDESAKLGVSTATAHRWLTRTSC